MKAAQAFTAGIWQAVTTAASVMPVSPEKRAAPASSPQEAAAVGKKNLWLFLLNAGGRGPWKASSTHRRLPRRRRRRPLGRKTSGFFFPTLVDEGHGRPRPHTEDFPAAGGGGRWEEKPLAFSFQRWWTRAMDGLVHTQLERPNQRCEGDGEYHDDEVQRTTEAEIVAELVSAGAVDHQVGLIPQR